MTHIPMTRAVQIRKLVEKGEDTLEEIAAAFKIPVERVKGLAGVKDKPARKSTAKKATAKKPVAETVDAAEENWEE